jgi:hypothetical protein
MRREAAPLNRHPGCWEVGIDQHWWIAVNAHNEPKTCSKGTEVAPFACYVGFNGWPAGILTPTGGALAAGSLANEETFLAALAAAK